MISFFFQIKEKKELSEKKNSTKTFSLDNDLRSKTVENNRKINNVKEIFGFVLSFFLIFIYIYMCVGGYVCFT